MSEQGIDLGAELKYGMSMILPYLMMNSASISLFTLVGLSMPFLLNVLLLLIKWGYRLFTNKTPKEMSFDVSSKSMMYGSSSKFFVYIMEFIKNKCLEAGITTVLDNRCIHGISYDKSWSPSAGVWGVENFMTDIRLKIDKRIVLELFENIKVGVDTSTKNSWLGMKKKK